MTAAQLAKQIDGQFQSALDGYKLCVANQPGLLSARMLRDQALALGLTDAVKHIERLARTGSSYSYESFDVLASAYAAIDKATR